MKLTSFKTYYLVILNILTGILVIVSPPLASSASRGTSFIFGIDFIASSILMLYDKKRLRTYAQILTILDGFIAVTGLILLASNFVEIIVPLIMIGLIASASLFSYDVIKRN